MNTDSCTTRRSAFDCSFDSGIAAASLLLNSSLPVGFEIFTTAGRAWTGKSETLVQAWLCLRDCEPYRTGRKCGRCFNRHAGIELGAASVPSTRRRY